MLKVYKILNVLGWLFGLAAFVFAGIAMLREYPVLGILCFVAVVLAVIVGIFQRGRLFSGDRKKITTRTIIWYIILTGTFIALLVSGSYDMIVLMFGIAIILNITANLTQACRKE